MKEIPLPCGKVALVDDEDFDSVNQYRWVALKVKRKLGTDSFYAVRFIYRVVDGRKVQSQQRMHRFILGDSRMIDHKDGDGLNNQRSNLRFATNSQNQANRHLLDPNATSKFRGVCWSKQKNKWRSLIKVNQKGISIGLFDSEEDAARAYDEKAREYFGEFAFQNFPLTRMADPSTSVRK